MRTKHFRAAFLFLPFSIVAVQAAPIQNLTFTEVVKDVFVIDPATKKETPAKAGDKLVPPNVLKTGGDSRAELVAEDKTVTRVGSNTIFSVEANSRDVNLAQGSVLFHSPTGRGGGRIKSAGATASVLGTTLAVSANADGGFKTSLLEGKGEVKDSKGGKVGLVAGQVTFAKPGGGLSPALNFDLKAQISNSKLVGGFSTPIASIAKIEAAVAVQQAKIAGGGLVSTGMLIGDRPDTAFKVDPAIVDGQIRQSQTRRIEREKAAMETKTFYEVDPRYLTSILQKVVISLNQTIDEEFDPNTGKKRVDKITGEPVKVPNYAFYLDQTAPDRHVFVIDRTGRASMEPDFPNAIGVVPSNLPGNQQDTSVTYHALIANEIKLNIEPETLGTIQNASIRISEKEGLPQEVTLEIASGSLPGWIKPGVMLTGAGLPSGTMVTNVTAGLAYLNQAPVSGITQGPAIGEVKGVELPEFFLPIPLIDKVGGALVARGNLDFTGAIEFVGIDNIDTTPDGYETGQTLLLSAGRTLKVTPGSVLVANTSLLEIYTGGTSFAGDLSLSLLPLGANETPVALELDRVTLINNFPMDTSRNSNSTIRISAPEMSLKDTLLVATSESSEIHLKAAGNITIGTNTTASPIPDSLLNLGITSAKDLCIKAFKVGILSNSKTVSISGVSLFANDITLRGGDELKLTSVTIDPFDFQRDQTLAASAANNVTIDSGAALGETQSKFLPSAVSTTFYSDNADILISNTEFGSTYIAGDDTAPKTTFTAKAFKGAISLTAATINADQVFINPLEVDPLKPETALFDGKAVTIQGVSIAPTDSDKGTIEVKSGADLTVSTGRTSRANSFKAYKIVLDARNNMTLEDLAVNHPASTAGSSEFRAKAAAQLEMSRVALGQAQTVALEAQTVVLSDVQFKDGANVSLISEKGVLSTPVERAQITKGWVNVMPRVMYGPHDLHDLKHQMNNPAFATETATSISNTPTVGIPGAKVGAAIEAQFKVRLPNLTVGKK